MRWDKFFHILKFYRRRTSQFARELTALGDSARVWPSLCSDLDRLVNTIATKVEPDAPCLGNASFVLCTDASDTGFGAILFDSDGAWKMFNGRWNINEIHEIIAVKELLAILKAIEHWQIASSFHLLCDNTIALAALAKGYSPHFCINAVVSAIFDEVRTLHNLLGTFRR